MDRRESECVGFPTGKRNERSPRPKHQERKPWTLCAEAHSTGSKANASPLSTNRGRRVLSSLRWAVPSCQPDVSSWPAGGAKLYWSPCRPARRMERERTAGDRVVAERSNGFSADSPTVFLCWIERGNPYAQRGRRFVTSTKHQLTCWRLPCGWLSKTRLGPLVRAWGQERPTRQPAVEKRIGRRGLELFEYTQPWLPDVATHTHRRTHAAAA